VTTSPTTALVAGSGERDRDPLGDPSTRPGISGVAYDTAWLAGMSAPTDPRGSRFPTALRWLVANQLSDGSWGSSVRYEHDRVLCTLAALAPLAEFGRHADERRAVEAGTRYLWQHGHLLSSEQVELVGFELLVPALVQRARAAGVPVPPHLDIYARQRAQKLDLIPPEAMYSPRATIVHSLEFLGDQADLAGLEAAQGQNGALGNSPAATAFYLQQTQSNNPQALDYLNSCMGRGASAGATAPVLHPCDTFELLWAAYHLYVGGAPSQGILRPTERRRLLADLAQTGVSLSRTFPIPDADDTAVALLLMHDLGEQVDPRVLQPFEAADGSFVSFPYERHSSVGVNAHVLHTLTRVPGYPDAQRAIERILTYLIDQHTGLYWIDKWHISPLYATAHVLAALENVPPELRGRVAELIDRSREWLRQSQNADGSWGFYGQSTAEETAYGLLALEGNRELDERDRARSAAAARFLKAKRRENGAHPPLWIDKCLYVPPLVVNAAIDGALTAWNKRVNRKDTRSASPESLPPYQYSHYRVPVAAEAQPANRRRAHAAVVARNH
jgi:halimadienyl-diphosphate synthase